MKEQDIKNINKKKKKAEITIGRKKDQVYLHVEFKLPWGINFLIASTPWLQPPHELLFMLLFYSDYLETDLAITNSPQLQKLVEREISGP